MFWEFFTFELKFRFKSVSTYVYFAVWFAFSFLDIAAENFGVIGYSNGKALLNGPYANIYNDIGISFLGIIVITAIFGTSILRDFQRDTVQILFTKPISKVFYLGDGSGDESPMSLHDPIDIGIFTGKKDDGKPLYLQEVWLSEPTRTFEIVVDQPPTRVGIDPHNKLIDRNSDDNLMDVTKRSASIEPDANTKTAPGHAASLQQRIARSPKPRQGAAR